ncbi:hypothetical protein Aperf_G00000105027 [Anoplocephala perfoliata]
MPHSEAKLSPFTQMCKSLTRLWAYVHVTTLPLKLCHDNFNVFVKLAIGTSTATGLLIDMEPPSHRTSMIHLEARTEYAETSARDILWDDFDPGLRFVDYRGSRGDSGYTSWIDYVFQYGNMYGSFHSSFFWKKYGIMLTDNWYSRGFVSAQASVANLIADGITNYVTAGYDASSRRTNVIVKSVYTNDYVNGELNFKVRYPFPDVGHSLVVAYQNFVVGVDMNFDSNRKKLKFLDLAFAYSVSDFRFHAFIKNWAQTFTAGLHQRITDHAEYAAERTWHRNDSTSAWALCLQYAVDKERKHILKLKLDNQQRIFACMINQVLQGVRINVSLRFSQVEATQIGLGVKII